MPNLVVERHAAKLRSAVYGAEIVKGRGLDELARREIELRLLPPVVLHAQPIKKALVGGAFALRSEIQNVAIALTLAAR